MNIWEQFQSLKRTAPTNVGTVVSAVGAGRFEVEEIGGQPVVVTGSASVGQRVFFRDGKIEGTAPDLPVQVVEF